MNKLAVEKQRDPLLTFSYSSNVLEIEKPQTPTISNNELTDPSPVLDSSITVQKREDTTITLYMTEPKSIILEQRDDTTQTLSLSERGIIT
tara:strand:+ start:1281 stop:1553 length:273 start_codon:yes stop_codon:yes gene_type:complete